MNIPNDGRRARGRPRAFDEDAVLAAAMDMFWRVGYSRAAVPELTAATGLSTSSLYNAHGSKLGLFEAALERYLDVVIDGRMIGPMERGAAGLLDLEAFLQRLERTLVIDPPRGCLAVNTIGEFRDPPAPVARMTRAYRALLHSGLRAALTRAEHLGEIPAGTAHRRADLIAPIVLAFNLLVASGAPAPEARTLLEAARALAADGA